MVLSHLIWARILARQQEEKLAILLVKVYNTMIKKKSISLRLELREARTLSNLLKMHISGVTMKKNADKDEIKEIFRKLSEKQFVFRHGLVK